MRTAEVAGDVDAPWMWSGVVSGTPADVVTCEPRADSSVAPGWLALGSPTLGARSWFGDTLSATESGARTRVRNAPLRSRP